MLYRSFIPRRPQVGGVLVDLATWRASFIFAIAAALIWLTSTIFIMPETRTEVPATETQAVHNVYIGLFRHRGFLAFMITHPIAYAGLYCFIADQGIIYNGTVLPIAGMQLLLAFVTLGV